MKNMFDLKNPFLNGKYLTFLNFNFLLNKPRIENNIYIYILL